MAAKLSISHKQILANHGSQKYTFSPSLYYIYERKEFILHTYHVIIVNHYRILLVEVCLLIQSEMHTPNKMVKQWDSEYQSVQ